MAPAATLSDRSEKRQSQSSMFSPRLAQRRRGDFFAPITVAGNVRRRHVLNEQARDEWHVREHAGPIYPTMAFVPEGLVLGAGTVIVPVEALRRLQSLRGQKARVLALLSAANRAFVRHSHPTSRAATRASPMRKIDLGSMRIS
jgi:hypothetical protein